MKISLVVFREKLKNLIFLVHFLLFDWAWSKLNHCYCWILKQSEHDFFHVYYWILIQSVHDFSGKHLCDGYCMDM